MSKQRVLVIGIDGGTWTVLKPMIDNGFMPHLKALCERGVSGILNSTIPAHSTAAWTSFMTGKNPGKHGVFGFTNLVDEERRFKKLVSSRDIKSDTLFSILNSYGKVVCSVNLPMTYPIKKINGAMITDDLLTPSLQHNFFYPSDLFERIGMKREDYIVSMPEFTMEPPAFLALLRECTGKRKDAALQMMKVFDWDLFILVFTETDRLQHCFWRYMDPTHSLYKKEEAEALLPAIKNYFFHLDQSIGEITNYIDENTVCFVMSDHGFGPYEGNFRINVLLEKENLLFLKKNMRRKQHFSAIIGKLRGCFHRNSALYRNVKMFIKKKTSKYQTNKKLENRLIGPSKDELWHVLIDREKTKVYYPGFSCDGLIYVSDVPEGHGAHDVGQKDAAEKEKVFRQVDTILKTMKDPLDGKELHYRLFRREEIYKGPYAKHAPDFLVDARRDRFMMQSDFSDQLFYLHPQILSGCHRPEGILVVSGNVVNKNNKSINAEIIDIAPTILHLLGIPVSGDIDGRVMKDIIRDDFSCTKAQPCSQEILQGHGRINIDRNEDEDTAQVEERLRSLGYL